MRVQRGEDDLPMVKLINRSKRKRIVVISSEFEQPEVPKGPSADVLKFAGVVPDAMLEHVREVNFLLFICRRFARI